MSEDRLMDVLYRPVLRDPSGVEIRKYGVLHCAGMCKFVCIFNPTSQTIWDVMKISIKMSCSDDREENKVQDRM